MIAEWAREEMSTVELGDQRLDTRSVELLSALGKQPNLSIPAACKGRAEIKAAYAFFDNGKVTFEKVLEPHYARTLERIAGQDVVLLVQDTTEIDVTRPEQEVVGVGDLDGCRRGFLLHELHAFTARGIPLGTVWAEAWNRTEGVSHESAPRLQDMVHMVASLGGYIERRNSEPGAQTMWIGMQRMYDLAWAWDAFGPEVKMRGH
jgi:hypothetical protein